MTAWDRTHKRGKGPKDEGDESNPADRVARLDLRACQAPGWTWVRRGLTRLCGTPDCYLLLRPEHETDPLVLQVTLPFSAVDLPVVFPGAEPDGLRLGGPPSNAPPASRHLRLIRGGLDARS